MHDVRAERLSMKRAPSGRSFGPGWLARRNDDRDVRISSRNLTSEGEAIVAPGICTSVNSSVMHAWCSSSTSKAIVARCGLKSSEPRFLQDVDCSHADYAVVDDDESTRRTVRGGVGHIPSMPRFVERFLRNEAKFSRPL